MVKRQNHTLNIDSTSHRQSTGAASFNSQAPLRGAHPVYDLVGQIAAEFSRAEHFLDVAIWQLAGLRGPIGACLTAQMMGVRPRCLTLLALAKYRGFPETVCKEIRQLINESAKPSDERNRLIHDAWYVDTQTGETAQLRLMPKDTLAYGHTPVSEADCLRVYEMVQKFAKKAEILRGHLLAELKKQHASSEKRSR